VSPRPRSDMRKIRDVIRLTFAMGLTRRQVADALHLAPSTVSDCIKRAQTAGLSWPLPAELDTPALERRLFPSVAPPTTTRPMPDWNYVRKELARVGVTKWLLWEEYREVLPDILFDRVGVVGRGRVAALRPNDQRGRGGTLFDLAGVGQVPHPRTGVKGRCEPPLHYGSRSAFGRPLTPLRGCC